jgi:hypothetical protein
MAAEFILITETAGMMFGDLTHEASVTIGVHCGAAQDMDLFLQTRLL